MKRWSTAIGLIVWAGLASPAAVSAQQGPPATQQGPPATPQTPAPAPAPRPSNAVFRGSASAPHDTLSAQISAISGYDDEFSGADEQGPIAGAAAGGAYSGSDVTLSYAPLTSRRVTFDFRGGSGVRYYARPGDFVLSSSSFSAGSSIPLSRRFMLQARGGFSFTPYFDFSVLPDMDTNPNEAVEARIRDNSLSSRQVFTYDGGVDLTHSVNERTSLSLSAGARKTTLLDEDQSSVDTTISAGFGRRFNRRLSGRVNYVHRDGQYFASAVDQSITVDDVRVSLDKDWARSPTRHTVFSVTVGPAVVQQQGAQMTQVFGGVSVVHPFARSWNLRAMYRRGVTFLDGSVEPFLSHAGTFGLNGLLTRRLDLTVSAGAVLGDIGLEGATAASGYDTYSSTVQVNYAITRSLALYGEAVRNYSKYSAAGPGTPAINRNGVRVGLTLYWPLVQEPTARRPQ